MIVTGHPLAGVFVIALLFVSGLRRPARHVDRIGRLFELQHARGDEQLDITPALERSSRC